MELKESGFQFLNPRIKYTEFIVNDDFDSSLYKGIDVSCKKEEKRLESNSAQVDLIVTIGSKAKEAPFFINIRISSLFEWKYGMSENNVEKLLNQNSIGKPVVLNSFILSVTSIDSLINRYEDITKKSCEDKNILFIDVNENNYDTIDTLISKIIN